MPITVAVARETLGGENRVALVPETVARLTKMGFAVCVEEGAGFASHIRDEQYRAAGAEICTETAALYARADIIVAVQPPAPEAIRQFRKDTILISFLQPHLNLDRVRALQEQGVTAFSMELVPRITRAQSIDALSSQATVAGYKAVLMGADLSGKFFPMLTTAAGTIRPARVLVLGAGVAGLQAIATARRLGAIVEAYDVRRAAREQVESLGARFLQVEMDAEAEGGYARELTEDEKQREQVLLWRSVEQADVVITTAQIPGRKAPCLVSQAMVEKMQPGSVIIDLAAESGGNCELTEKGQLVDHNSVLIKGPTNVASMVPVHASEMYAKNILNFLVLLGQDVSVAALDWEDEILAGSVVTHGHEIRHQATREALTGEQS